MLRNASERFGLLTISLHWLMAVAIFSLFFLGLYMTDLTYYDRFYKIAPWIHKSIGVLVFLTLIVRWVWHRFSPTPALLPAPRWEQHAAKITHKILYVLILATTFSGYLISTAKGDPVEVFNWFAIPALPALMPNQEDLAGEIHEVVAFILIGLAFLHASAALKHHFWDKDATLKRMLGRG
jgi:cytochrome b561